jgi:hypothetical protein
MIEWKSLTPEQRNALVAEKVMGWQPKECDGEIDEQPVSPDGWFCQKCGVRGFWGDDFIHEERPKRYSECVDQALAAAETFTSVFSLTYTRDQCYVCKLYDAHYSVHCGASKHAAEAICIALLLFRGIEVNHVVT